MNIAALLAGLFSGILGSMGLGGGAVLVIYLSLFTDTPQLKSQGINLLFFIPIALVAVIIYCKQGKIEWKKIYKIILFGLLGTVVGWLLATYFEGETTAKIFGGLLILMGINELFRNKTVATRQNK